MWHTSRTACPDRARTDEESPVAKPHPRVIIVLVLAAIVALVVLPMLLTEQPGTVKSSGGVISKKLAAIDTDAEATYRIRLLEGGDAAHEASHIFEALAGLPGLGSVALDTASLDLKVSYASGQTDDEPFRARLLAAGYLVPTAEDAAPAKLDASGGVQRIAVSDDHGFQPAYIRAKAGVPLEIEFGPGTECRTSVRFPELEITADISKGGVVKLPAMEPGTYTIACSGDAPEGAIIVE